MDRQQETKIKGRFDEIDQRLQDLEQQLGEVATLLSLVAEKVGAVEKGTVQAFVPVQGRESS